MKNNMKKRVFAALTAGFLTITPTVAASFTMLTANAASITITDADVKEHDYRAYQIFAGTATKDSSGNATGKLEVSGWGSNVDTSSDATGVTPGAIIEAINTALGIKDTPNALAADATATTVAEKLNGINDDVVAQKIAKGLRTLFEGKGGTSIPKVGTSDQYKVDNDSVTDGWYLILDETTDLDSTDPDGVRSANMLKVVGNASMTTKHSLPSITKKIVEGDQKVDANTAAIGDVITYEITVKVPDVRGYENYFYNVVDTLSEGLTYNNDLVITSPSYITADKYYVKDPVDNGANGTNITLVFKKAVELFAGKTVGEDIVIRYTATLNEKAKITAAGNPNNAKLVYSNNPSSANQGTPGTDDEPGSGSPVGETPDETVITYTTAIEIIKVDQDGKPLKGAEFQLVSEDYTDIRIISGSKFVEEATGEYYKLKDGSYTKDGSGDDNLYVSKETKYKKVSIDSSETSSGYFIEKTTAAADNPYTATAYVGSDGKLRFEGLKPGKYTLKEINAPANYNPDTTEYTIIIKATLKDDKSVEWSVDTGSTDKVRYVGGDTNAFVITIENKLGATLPETGGIGTKMFYLFGGLLTAGSAIFLITRKRMSVKEN